MKKCIKCDNDNDNDNEFNDININLCKKCLKKEKNNKYLREYRKRDYVKKKNAKSYKEYRLKNLDKVKAINKKSYDLNKHKYIKNKRAYDNKRIKSNPSFKLRKSLSNRIYLALKGNKKFSILKYLPYSIEELKFHLEKQFEPWMNWNNWSVYDPQTWDDKDSLTWKWQIDHIIAQIYTPYTSMEEENFKKCWALSNLRPYSAKLNVTERHKRNVKN